jgi:hypothetical protein
MRTDVLVGLGVFICVIGFKPPIAARQTGDGAMSFCRPAGKFQVLAGVPEASGAVVSSRDPAVLWTLNDSGQPQLFAFDAAGKSTRTGVTGAELRDWEDLASGKCPVGNCLYVADIGDNRGSRKLITIYRVPEPEPGIAATAAVEAFHAVYPDQPHDAEAFVVTDGWYVVTKEIPPRVYRFPSPVKPGATATLQFVRSINERMRITGAAVSLDGRWVALRSNRTLIMYRTEDFADGRNPIRIDLTSLKEPQGEGIAFGRGGDLYLVSEAGEDATGGTLRRLNCALPK